jgi:hypothetical protein
MDNEKTSEQIDEQLREANELILVFSGVDCDDELEEWQDQAEIYLEKWGLYK